MLIDAIAGYRRRGESEEANDLWRVGWPGAST